MTERDVTTLMQMVGIALMLYIGYWLARVALAIMVEPEPHDRQP